jgi:hypothetical protein
LKVLKLFEINLMIFHVSPLWANYKYLWPWHIIGAVGTKKDLQDTWVYYNFLVLWVYKSISYLITFEPDFSRLSQITSTLLTINNDFKLWSMAHSLSTEVRQTLKIKYNGIWSKLWKVKSYGCPFHCFLIQLLNLKVYKMPKCLFNHYF